MGLGLGCPKVDDTAGIGWFLAGNSRGSEGESDRNQNLILLK